MIYIALVLAYAVPDRPAARAQVSFELAPAAKYAGGTITKIAISTKTPGECIGSVAAGRII